MKEEVFCERCSKKTDRPKMIGIMDSQTKKKKLMWLCPECYNEHTWEEPDGSESTKDITSSQGSSNKVERDINNNG